MPLTTKQHIDFVQCTFARADTWALWQDSFPEDKPLESLFDILKLGRGYRHLAEFAPSSVKVIFRVLTGLGLLGGVVHSSQASTEPDGTATESGYGSTMMKTR